MIYENLYLFDDSYRKAYGEICGVDEAGRGPLVGPVAVAAVILEPGVRYEWLNDSKKVTEKRRERLYGEIIGSCVAYHVELIDNRTIDEMNILGATLYGMKICVEKMQGSGAAAALIDGNKTPAVTCPAFAVVKGDANSASIAAASILAKVTRDRFMEELGKQYPCYGFEKHKGYPTKEHYEAIKKYGITEYHRMSFLKNLEKH